MQSLYLLCRSSGGGIVAGIFPPLKDPTSFLGTWAHPDRRLKKQTERTGPVGSSAGSSTGSAFCGGESQDHYAVLGISRLATAGEVKKAFRLLAIKYHPDVSRDSQAGEVFKSILVAYEVLSNEVARAQYDMMLKFPERRSNSHRRKWAHSPESAERMHRWANLRHQMQQEQDENQDQETYVRGSFGEVLRVIFFALLFTQMVGHRASLAICGAVTLLDNGLDFGYKTGYMIAWIFGGSGGILLALCIYFASWLWGKKSSGLVAITVVAMWVGTSIARFAPIPQGALLALLYMSLKIQVDSDYRKEA